MQIIRGRIPGAKKVVVYGPEGIGKSTFASHFPDPLFIDTEGSTKDMDVARLEAPSSWAILLDQVRYVKTHPDICRTLVIDTADWAEMLCTEAVCAKSQKSGIEDFGYGKGYVYLAEEFGRLLNLLTEVIGQGIHVVVTAHAKMRKFEQPDEMGAYDRWELKLQKQTAPLLKEWADMVLFANYKTIVVNVDGQGAQKGKNKAQGGKRVMYTSHHPCWDAKNRYGLPDELPFDYEAIRPVIEAGTAAPVTASPVPETPRQNSMPAAELPKVDAGVQMNMDDYLQPAEDRRTEQTAPDPVLPPPRVLIDSDPAKVPQALQDLMRANGVIEWDIQNVCESKGYVPTGTPLDQYDVVNPGFVEGVLIGAWDQVYQAIRASKEKDEIPFN